MLCGGGCCAGAKQRLGVRFRAVWVRVQGCKGAVLSQSKVKVLGSCAGRVLNKQDKVEWKGTPPTHFSVLPN